MWLTLVEWHSQLVVAVWNQGWWRGLMLVLLDWCTLREVTVGRFLILFVLVFVVI